MMATMVNGKGKKRSEIESVELLYKSIERFVRLCGDGFTYPLILFPSDDVDENILLNIYENLSKIGHQKQLNILLYSHGGDPHIAFHIGRLLQMYSDYLRIFIVRKAKSAATLISCAADEIVFTTISELGPVDPQLTNKDRDDRFSPLAIKHTFDLLDEESKKGHKEIVKSLADKFSDPLMLGEYLKSLEMAKEYISKLLVARMMKDSPDKAEGVAEKLVTGYTDHNYCIDLTEARNIGLNATVNDQSLDETMEMMIRINKLVWDIYTNNTEGKTRAIRIHMSFLELSERIIDIQLEKNKHNPVTKGSGSKKATKKG